MVPLSMLEHIFYKQITANMVSWVDGASFHARTYILETNHRKHVFLNTYSRIRGCYINFPVTKMPKISIKIKLIFQSYYAINIYTNYFKEEFFFSFLYFPVTNSKNVAFPRFSLQLYSYIAAANQTNHKWMQPSSSVLQKYRFCKKAILQLSCSVSAPVVKTNEKYLLLIYFWFTSLFLISDLLLI